MTLLMVLDVEATGGDILKHQVVAVGFALVDLRTRRLLANEERVVAAAYLTSWEPRCVSEFWSKHAGAQALLAATRTGRGVAPAEVAAWLHAAVVGAHAAATAEGCTLLLGSDNLSFDLGFLDVLLSRHDLPSCKHSVDSVYLGERDVDSYADGAQEALGRGIDVDTSDLPPHDHWPKNDAAHTALHHAALCALVEAERGAGSSN